MIVPEEYGEKAVSAYLYSTFTLQVEEHGKILSDHTYSTVTAVLEELGKRIVTIRRVRLR